MKTRRMIRLLVQKTFWNFSSRPVEFWEEGSFVYDPEIEAKRVKIISRLLKEKGLAPTPRMAKIVDFCAFMTRELVDSEEHAYQLYLAISQKFSDNHNYNKLLAKREIAAFQSEHALRRPDVPFVVGFTRKRDDDDRQYYRQYCKASLRVDRYFDNPLTRDEIEEAAKIQIGYYNLLYAIDFDNSYERLIAYAGTAKRPGSGNDSETFPVEPDDELDFFCSDFDDPPRVSPSGRCEPDDSKNLDDESRLN